MRTTPWREPIEDGARDEVLARVDRYVDALATDVVERDAAGAPPQAQIDRARASGLLGLMIPVEHGGLGGDWSTAFEAVRRIARVDPGVAQLIGYHFINESTIGFVAPDAAQAAWYRRSAEGGWFWADAVNPLDPAMHLTATPDDAWRLDGTKRYASGSDVADRILVLADRSPDAYAVEGELPPVFLAIDAASSGIEHLGDWDNLGQRLTASGTVRFDATPATDADMIGPSPRDPFSLMQPPGIQLMFGALYLGIGEGALAAAVPLIVGRPAWPSAGVAQRVDDPLVQRLIGDLDAHLAAAAALTAQATASYDAALRRGTELTWADRADAAADAARVKVVTTEAALAAAERGYEAAGASATKRSVGLDRYWRDIRTISLHDPVDQKRRELGARLLGAEQPTPGLYT